MGKTQKRPAAVATAVEALNCLSGRIDTSINTQSAGRVQADLIPRRKLEAIRAQLIGADRCVVDGHTTRGPSPILAMCRHLIVDAGYDPKLSLEAYRGDVLCIRVKSIGQGAEFTIEDDASGRPRLRRHRKGQETSGTAPPVRPNDETGSDWTDWPPCDGATGAQDGEKNGPGHAEARQ